MRKILLVFILGITLIGCGVSRDKIYKTYTEEDKDLIVSFGSFYLDYFTNDDKYKSLIENENFKSEYIGEYLNNYSLYSLDDLIYLVNNGYIKEYGNSEILAFYNEPHFYIEYLPLYIQYKDYGSIDDTITYVNVKNYKGYYIDTEQTDLSLGCLVQANKHYYLGESYVPSNLVKIDDYDDYINEEAYEHFKQMRDALKEEGFNLVVISGYRSYTSQYNIYNYYLDKYGSQEVVDEFSSRPGYSDHQTGYTVDISVDDVYYTELASSKAYDWLKDNSYKYGFIIRYPEGKENITGYEFEAWHYRYVGLESAEYIYKNGLTFDEYYEYNVLRSENGK